VAKKTIGLKDIRALQPGETIWDAKVSGFCARRQKSEAVTYLLKYRTSEGRQRWATIGRHGSPWTPEMARDEAIRLLGEVVKGADPSGDKQDKRKAATVGELCDLYLAEAQAGRLIVRRGKQKKASTLAIDAGRIERHIKPLLARRPVAAVTRDDIEEFMHSVAAGETAARIKTGKYGLARVAGGMGTATRTVGLLGGIFSFAIKKGLRADNPVRGVDRPADGRRERRLTVEEYARLGAALHDLEAEMWPPALALAKFLAMTGWRRGEAIGLRWAEVDLATQTARLRDTKTGESLRPLSHLACAAIRSAAMGTREPDKAVFPASRGEGPMAGFPKFWLRIAKKAALPPEVTPHVLRHSAGSVASDAGYSELTIANLLGHRKNSVTSRYTHAADAVLLAAADDVADRIADMMGDRKPEATVVKLRPAK
jgi:integrase